MTLPFVGADRIRTADARHFRDLTDPLGPLAIGLNRTLLFRKRGESERDALTVFDRTRPDGISAGPFRETILMLNAAVASESQGWRAGDVGFEPDATGASILLPPASAIGPILGDLELALKRYEWPPVCRAAVAAALLLNAHPFTDGNGRTARVLVNMILRDCGMPSAAFIPLYELAQRSCGGFEIALRRTEILGDWGSIIAWLIHAIDAYAEIAGTPPSA